MKHVDGNRQAGAPFSAAPRPLTVCRACCSASQDVLTPRGFGYCAACAGDLLKAFDVGPSFAPPLLHLPDGVYFLMSEKDLAAHDETTRGAVWDEALPWLFGAALIGGLVVLACCAFGRAWL